MAKRRGSGEGSIFRDGNRWVACIDLPAPGGRVRRKRSARTYAEARAKLRELHEEARAGVAGAGRLSVAAYLDDWLANVLPARGVTVATTENYSTMIHHHVVPALGAIRLDRLRAEDVDGLLRDMAGAGKARSTIRLARTVLVLALTHAERRDMVARNAARLAVVPPGPVRESRSLTLDQAKALLEVAREDRLEAAWVVMLALGPRPGECFALRWVDLDLDAGVLHVRQAIRRAGGARFTLGEPKTKTSRRSVDMPGFVVEAFERQQMRQEADRLAAGDAWVDTGLVFTTAVGTMLDPSNTRRYFRELTTRAGLGAWHPHEARHSAVSILSAAGVSVEQIADVVGHAPGSRMTAEVYRHRITPSAGAAKAAMEDLFGSGVAPGEPSK